ncbi:MULTISPECIES: hypothetical protein [Streptomyces]|uniref:hypothetical protein n=1 Tax=Streptomyces TaxID=1883 RepID=UPI00163C3834|nr:MULTISPECIES: hypothetical protein [Streptomyces]MBC2879489.1 hypothetical protein [Streptomyces sp. TYQ1024]UBI35032.1 hypothetical protein K7I03_00230 [Streptomyces mobaraensis]UKW27629.1 hypothetical protein MCU78_00265 [Streptomyces sp. TYQ1024]UKW33372.1 hypothetical protein MCU78_32800 [Streptomyces sp. TYQ1024]
MAVNERSAGGHDAEEERRRAEGSAEGRLEAERLAGKEPDDRFANPRTTRAELSLSGAASGVATLTARGGNAIPKGIRVVDESGALIAAYIGLALDDLSVAKSARSSVAGALARALDGTDAEDEAKAESPAGVIVGRVGGDVPVRLTPEEFRNRAVDLFAGELIDLSQELRGAVHREAEDGPS